MSAVEENEDGFHHRRVDVGEVTLHVAEARPAGSKDGEVPRGAPLVVLLHGFPDSWSSWRAQMRALADAGMWAVAPDMRGYGESDKPAGVRSYEVENLARDVEGLIRALGRERAHVVGHDWGGAVAWTFAQERPAMLNRLAILNVPHPIAMGRGLRHAHQLGKSWYMFFFQLPRIPERFVARGNFAAVRKTFAKSGVTGELVDRAVDALRQPGALSGALAYYRAAARRVLRGRVPKMRVIGTSVLVIWGDEDAFLERDLAEPPARFVPNASVVHVPGASHWVHVVAAGEVNRLLLDFFRADGGSAA